LERLDSYCVKQQSLLIIRNRVKPLFWFWPPGISPRFVVAILQLFINACPFIILNISKLKYVRKRK
ncbi:hypothetical protein, partial [Staphylococcus pseudintermedius]|uniref:hypothetical protein n=1 Tax=Staphylococcus pseudintermedius TaxID=283734 RepID=UPI001F29EC9D